MSTVIILGSARKNGYTAQKTALLTSFLSCDEIDLLDYSFSQYDYDVHNRKDDFLPLLKQLIEQYDTFIFATPVYWYSMSGIMKMFFDRITDLLDIEKPLGRKLRGKNMGVITCSVGENLGEYFWLPFSKTASYLGMHFLGGVHTLESEDSTSDLSIFAQQLQP